MRYAQQGKGSGSSGSSDKEAAIIEKHEEEEEEDALKDLNLYIAPGSRVVVVGRTGSGKSSLLRCLLRLNDYYQGSILFNGHCELKSLSKHLLRRTATILPQKPLLFTGDLRSNVDPLHLHSDEDIMMALYESSFLSTLRAISREVESSESETAAPKGTETSPVAQTSSERRIDWSRGVENTITDVLSFPIEDSGSNLSFGQRQLLCLARALLKRSDFILIDEVSASLDVETKLLVFSALQRHVARFPSTILLMISHHLEGVEGLCNKVGEDCFNNNYYIGRCFLSFSFFSSLLHTDTETGSRKNRRVWEPVISSCQ